MAAPGTRQKLLGLIEDVEIITKDLFETISNSKQTEDGEEPIDTSDLLQLLIKKDSDVQDSLKTASEQAVFQRDTDSLQWLVDKRDQEILQLQKNLKEAETTLSTAIYQAKQKLQSVHNASSKTIPSEELIKYAHKISASNAVAAPSNWAPGDPRRPYPTDLEMRLGFLGKVNEIPVPGQSITTHVNYSDSTMTGSRQPTTLDHSAAATSQQAMPQNIWHATSDLAATMSITSQTSIRSEVKGYNKENEDVEVMSTDSSSSSSSDD